MLAGGKLPARPLPAVAAYLGNQRFGGALPYAGGLFDQPASLIEDMHRVAAIVETARDETSPGPQTSSKRPRRTSSRRARAAADG